MQQFETQGGIGPMGGALRPHRGTMILVFGILGLVLCLVFGIVAWVMGNGDLREMREGRMDPAGRDMTQIGRILGIVATCLYALAIVGYGFFIILAIVIGAAGAAGSP